jgi:hypothetical protein
MLANPTEEHSGRRSTARQQSRLINDVMHVN